MTIFPQEQDFEFGSFALMCTARALLDAIACSLRSLEDTSSPIPITYQSVRNLRLDQIDNLAEFLRLVNLGDLIIERKKSRVKDSIRIVAGSEILALKPHWDRGDIQSVVKWLAPAMRVDAEAPLGNPGRVLASMLGRRIEHTTSGESFAGNGNPEVEQVLQVVRQMAQDAKGPLKAKYIYMGLASALQVSPCRVGTPLSRLLHGCGEFVLHKDLIPTTSDKVQKIIQTDPRGWFAARYDLECIGSITSISMREDTIVK